MFFQFATSSLLVHLIENYSDFFPELSHAFDADRKLSVYDHRFFAFAFSASFA